MTLYNIMLKMEGLKGGINVLKTINVDNFAVF